MKDGQIDLTTAIEEVKKLDNLEMVGITEDNVEEVILTGSKSMSKTFNVCYLREYMDPEHQGDFFYAYETIYRNVP